MNRQMILTTALAAGISLATAACIAKADEVFLNQANSQAGSSTLAAAPTIATPVSLASAALPVVKQNTSMLTQVGKNNNATVAQYGNANLSVLSQQGTGNIATVTQSNRAR